MIFDDELGALLGVGGCGGFVRSGLCLFWGSV
jgi:hypothetical protein